jgi:hypothetical protein
LLGFFSRGFGHCSFSFLLLAVIHGFGARARGFGPGYCFLRVIFFVSADPALGVPCAPIRLAIQFLRCLVWSPESCCSYAKTLAPGRLTSHVSFLLFAGSRVDSSARLVLALIFVFLSRFSNCAHPGHAGLRPQALCLAPGASTTGFGLLRHSSRFCCQIKILFVCEFLQVKSVLFLSHLIKRLEDSWFKLFFRDDFLNAPTRCSVKSCQDINRFSI